ncbi:aldehyde dehydrogenase (NADP(+)) [Methylobacterium oryzae]|uniref:Aldehyde dehydrogenase (NADP(+)) n=1 Tax=Methylobacterium oryzae TaxID=334852 RepID=A0ABU7TRF1_9HYPH
MEPRGENLIGPEALPGRGEPWRALEAATGRGMEPCFTSATPGMVQHACVLADAALDAYRGMGHEARAAFLERIASEILDLDDALIERCMAESGLPRARLEGERARTVGQLRMFAGEVRSGGFLGARVDPALPERRPSPRPDLRLRNVPVGPVAVFGASNFPLAFSVAGGDTASALAAGCPVVAKAHPAHPGTSELVGRAVANAVARCRLPAGVFSLLFDHGFTVGEQLVADPRIAAVGFTGSRAGGMALMRIAAARPVPIPVYAEMSSINPVVLFPAAAAARGAEIGRAFVAALTLGSGQFCTNPGLVLGIEGSGLDDFLDGAARAIGDVAAQTMLTPGIAQAYRAGVAALEGNPAVAVVARGRAGDEHRGRPVLFSTHAADFLADRAVSAEVFGAASLVVRCGGMGEVRAILERLEGQLTASLHMDADDHPAAQSLMPLLERRVGRILSGGFGTGVEVGHAMVHGGPYPATSDGRTTSVGSLAVGRFLRPVCYQDIPDDLLPPELRDDGPTAVPRLRDGRPG